MNQQKKNRMVIQESFFELFMDAEIYSFIERLEKMDFELDSAGICVSSPIKIARLLKSMQFDFKSDSDGYRIEIHDTDHFLEWLCVEFNGVDGIYKAWNALLHEIAEDINTLFQYGYSYKDTVGELAFLRNTLVYLCLFQLKVMQDIVPHGEEI